MKKPLFTGVCTAMVTPFLDEKVNFPMMEVLLRRQHDAGVRCCVICGTTGEASTLTDEEKLMLFERSKAYMGNDMRILAGTGSNCTAHAVELSKKAEQTGVDGLLVVSPYYNKATDDGLIAHYNAICNAVGISVIAYNVPSRTGMDIPVHAYQKLQEFPNMAGIKEASRNIEKITAIRKNAAKLCIYCGNDDMITPVIALGGMGVISVLSNILPRETMLLTQAALAGDLDTAEGLQTELHSLIQALFSQVNPVAVKAAMRLMGLDCGAPRLPLTSASKETLMLLRAQIR